MLIEKGIIVAADNDYIWIETIRKSACQACNARTGCGQALMSELVSPETQYKKNIVRVSVPENTGKIGDEINIGIHETALIKMAMLVYGLPVIGLLLGGVAGQYAGLSDPLVALASILTGSLVFLGVARSTRHWDCDHRYQPQLADPQTIQTFSVN